MGQRHPPSDDVKPKYGAAVEIDYTNYRGERGVRKIGPQRIVFKATPYHPDAQWILVAWDFEKHDWREFATQDIHSWKSLPYETDGEDKAPEARGG